MDTDNFEISFDEKTKTLIFSWDVTKEIWNAFNTELKAFLEKEKIAREKDRECDKEHDRNHIFIFKDLKSAIKVRDYLNLKFKKSLEPTL